MQDTDQDDVLLTEVSATLVARRSLVLAAVSCRGLIDGGQGQLEAEALHLRMLHWLDKFGLWSETEASEEKVLRTPLGELERKDAIQAGWYAEGLAIFAWALDQADFPKHDQEVEPYNIADALGFLSDNVEMITDNAKLQNSMKLQAGRELLYAIHVRLRDYIRNRERKNFASWIEPGWIDMLEVDMNYLTVQSDLAIDGEPLSDANNSRVIECEYIADERHRASIWLAEPHQSYSQISVDT